MRRAGRGAGNGAGKGAGKAARRWLLLGHRWLGIVTGLFFALWIGSGLVMLSVPFPSLSRAERLDRLEPIAWDGVRIGPDAALSAAGLPTVPFLFTLEMRDGEPVYRIAGTEGARRTVSAVSGAVLGPVTEAQALRIAGGSRSEVVGRDQWTVTARYDPLRPFHKVALGDAAGTDLYVSAVTGEIALDTTRWERGWNWVGAVTHWVYLTPLRARPEAWRQAVLWLSGVASATALTGVTIGLWRLRLRHRYRGGAMSPYRGLALWHHGFGLLGGIGLVSFIVSGWLSMNPNRWFSSLTPPDAVWAAYAGRPGAVGVDVASLADLGGSGARALRFVPIGGRWWIVREDGERPRIVAGFCSSIATGSDTSLSHGALRCARDDDAGDVTASLDGTVSSSEAQRSDPAAPPVPDIHPPSNDAAFIAAASQAVAGARLTEVRRLTAYDAYWYPNGTERPLPVLRLIFDDPAATWLHIDPRDGTILNRLDRSGRINRWLFDAAHRLDLPGLTLRPLGREAAQWILNLLAAGVAVTGLVLGWRRVRVRTGR
nr:PepSY domain-containing protein [Methylobacterium aerolatum]